MALSKDEILDIIKNIEPKAKAIEHRNQLTITLDTSTILGVSRELRDNPLSSFDMLIDITAIDWNRSSNRFEVVYNLWSNKNKQWLRLKVPVQFKDCICPSITEIWESANWYERETFDMYGIKFEGHPNLRRFYMPEDYKDPESGEPIYPLRKDFPLMGIPDSLPLPPYPERDGQVR